MLDLNPKKRGSMEEQMLALAERLAHEGAHATFVFSKPAPNWLHDGLADHGADVRVLDFRRPMQAAVTFWGWLNRGPRPDLVHFHFVRAYSPLVAMARLYGAKVVLHDHMTLGQAFVAVRRRHALERALVGGYKQARAALLNRMVDLRVAVSRFVADSVRGAEHVDAGQLRIVDNGIELGRFAGADGRGLREELRVGQRPLVACVASLSLGKGVDVLIRAMSRVGRDAMLLLVGEGADGAQLKALAAELNLGDHVRFLGRRDDVERVFAAADVVVAPSSCDEAFGLSVVEAMASGRPVVVTRSGALPEVVDNGRCGLIVPKQDDVALAGAIGRLLDDRGLATRLGRAAQERARNAYGLPAFVEHMTEVYASLLPGLHATASAAGAA